MVAIYLWSSKHFHHNSLNLKGLNIPQKLHCIVCYSQSLYLQIISLTLLFAPLKAIEPNYVCAQPESIYILWTIAWQYHDGEGTAFGLVISSIFN